MSNAYVDPWDMLNNFCFHVYAQKSLFIGENGNGFQLGTSSMNANGTGDDADVQKKTLPFSPINSDF